MLLVAMTIRVIVSLLFGKRWSKLMHITNGNAGDTPKSALSDDEWEKVDIWTSAMNHPRTLLVGSTPALATRALVASSEHHPVSASRQKGWPRRRMRP